MIDQIIIQLKSLGKEENRLGMQRYGINVEKAFGVNIPILRNLAKQHKNNHELALQLWDSEYHECRLLAVFIDNPKIVTEAQMDQWVGQFDSWDICDLCCSNLFQKTPFAWDKVGTWCHDEREYVRRAGFVMMAALSVHHKKVNDEKFHQFFPLIKKFSFDERNFVKKAVNWALRQIGKRSTGLHEKALETACAIKSSESKTARWIAADAIRELENEKIISNIKRKSKY